MSEYTPTTEEVREGYSRNFSDPNWADDAFDRWLAEGESDAATLQKAVAKIADLVYGNAKVVAERDAATAALERVRAIHVRTAFDDSAFDGSPDDFYCKPCQTTAGIWPCLTIQALDGAPEPEEKP